MTTTKATVLVVAALAVGTTLYARMGEEAAPSRSPDAVVATVDGSAITVADVDVELARMLGIPLDVMPAEQLEAMRGEMESEILESLIAMHLVQAQMDASGFEVSAADIDAFVAQIESELPESTSLVDQLEQAGVSEAEFRESVADDLRAQHVLQGVFADVAEPTDEEIEAFYDENAELFRVDETEDALPFEEVREEIGLRIGETRRWAAMQAWVESLKAEASIEYTTAALGSSESHGLLGADVLVGSVDNFSSLMDTDETVLVEFWAEWCNPCRTTLPIINAIATQHDGVRVVAVNIDASPELADSFGVRAVPTALVIRDGAVVDRLVGANTKARYEAALGLS